MAEFDFDELDKAVNTLMKNRTQGDATPTASNDTATMTRDENNQGSAQPQSDNSANSDENESTQDEASSDDSSSEDTEQNSSNVNESAPSAQDMNNPEQATTPTTATATASAPAASLATKRRGQFMDVMHPGGNMSGRATTASRPRPSRLGVDLQPGTKDTSDEQSDNEAADQYDMMSSPDSSSSSQNTMQSFGSNSADQDQIPENEQAEPTEQSSDSPSAPELPAMNADTDTAESSEPAVSPFLPDAKVEKRPLGGKMLDPSAEVTQAHDQAEVSAQAAQPVSNESLAAELRDDIMAVEGDANHAAAEQDTPEPAKAETDAKPETAPIDTVVPPHVSEPVVIPPAPVDTKQQSKTPSQAESDADHSPGATPNHQQNKAANQQPASRASMAGAATMSRPVGGVAAPAMHQASPAAHDEDSHGSIYDTEHLTTPPKTKKKTGLLVVLAVIGLLVVGSIGGVALYYVTNG